MVSPSGALRYMVPMTIVFIWIFGMNFMMWLVWEEKTGLLVGTSKCYSLVLGKSHNQSISTSMCEFNHWINNYQLCDIRLNNWSFTWSSGEPTQHSSLIDCFLLTNTCIAKLGTVKVQRLDLITSNHFPLSLVSGYLVWSRCPFHFENSWLLEQSFRLLIESW